MGKYFGTDGFRGEANKDLTVEHAFKVGRYLGYYYGKKNPEERIPEDQAICLSMPLWQDLQPAVQMHILCM